MKKITKLVLSIILVVVLFSFLISYLYTQQQKQFWITINGKISLTEESLDKYNKNMPFISDRPSSITIKHHIYDFNNYDADSREFAYLKINWTSDTEGYFKKDLEIPHNLDLFIYTRKEGDVPAVIQVSEDKKVYDVEIFWDGHYDSRKKPEDNVKRQRQRVSDLRASITELLSQTDIDEAYEKLVNEDRNKAENEVSLADGYTTDNETLLHLIYAEWYFRRAKYKLFYGELENLSYFMRLSP